MHIGSGIFENDKFLKNIGKSWKKWSNLNEFILFATFLYVSGRPWGHCACFIYYNVRIPDWKNVRILSCLVCRKWSDTNLGIFPKKWLKKPDNGEKGYKISLKY